MADDKTNISFEIKGKKYNLKKITNKEHIEINLKYGAALNRAMNEGLATNEDIISRIGKRQDKDEANAEWKTLREKVIKLEEELITCKTEKKKIDIALQLKNARLSFNSLTNSFAHMLTNTTESFADDIRCKWIAFYALTDDKNNRLFDNFDEFLESEDDAANEAMRQVMYRSFGLDPTGLSPEDTILKGAGRLTEDGFLLDTTGKIVNNVGMPIDKLGRLVDNDGFIINERGKYIGETGSLVHDTDKVKGVF
jgi:hypothetical protein